MKKKIIFLSIVGSILILYLVFTTGIAQTNVFAFLNPQYIIIKDKAILYQDGQTWQELSINSDNAKKALKKKYTVYSDSKTFKNVQLTYRENKWFLLEENSEIKNFRIAVLKNNIKLADYKLSNGIDDDDILVTDAIKKVDGVITQNYEYEKIIYDLDNDGIKENLYLATNISLEPNSIVPKSVIFIEKNNKITIIDSADLYRFDIEEIIDLDSDNQYELIIRKSKKVSNNSYDTCYQIYDFQNSEWKSQKSCTP